MWFVYILETQSGKLYTGITTHPERRFQEHRASPKGAKFFRTDPPKSIVYTETYATRSEASKREHAIKQMKRHEKEELVSTSFSSLVE